MSYLIIALLVVFGASAQAQDLAPHWQDRREHTVALAERACAGDAAGEAEVRRLFRRNDVVMLNSVAWLRQTCDNFSDITIEQAAEMQRLSAAGGYPIGVSNYGSRLIEGLGVNKNTELGIALKELAVVQGFAYSAYELARYRTRGNHLRRQLFAARDYLEQARAGGVDAKRIASLAMDIAKITNPNGAKPWMAIATAKDESGPIAVGVAVDFPTETAAGLAAKQICERNGGQGCQVTQALSSRSCAGYILKVGNFETNSFISGGKTRSELAFKLLSRCYESNQPGECAEPVISCSAEIYK